VGIIVPRFGNSAVARNQLKRRLRELVRIDLLDVKRSVDVIVFATKEAYRKKLSELRNEFDQVVALASAFRAD
jgi:ribonuclease P protein component